MQLKKTFRLTAVLIVLLLAISLLVVACSKGGDDNGGDTPATENAFELIENDREAVRVVEGRNEPGGMDGDYTGDERGT